MTVSDDLKTKVGPAMGRIASGVYIVTVGSDSDRDGMLATWICQAGFDPPSIVMAVNKQRDLLKRLEPGSGFAVNVLSKNNMDIFKAFAKPHNEGKFEGLALTEAKYPVFASAISYMLCRVKSLMDAGDHMLVLGEVVDGGINTQDEPMVHLRKDGFQY
jgi:flavin reductase (DIM6/NTAB) family NADH-FMN oxidoreductase RutF